MDRRDFVKTGLLGGAFGLVGGAGCRWAAWPTTRVDVGAAEVFRAAGVQGSFVLLDVRTNRTTVVNPELASRGLQPASTFKIPNTVIGLETGVIPDERFTLKWDGVRRDFVPAWNRDHDLRSAMKNSVLWYYQEIARRIGARRYHDWLARLDYGNRDIGGGLDRFWVAGDLRITPYEQVRFLARLLQGRLPVRRRSVEILKRILLRSESAGTVLLAKTGLTRQEPYKVGWLVGAALRPALTHVFACLVLGPSPGSWRASPVFRARRQVPLALLKRFSVVPADLGQPT